LDRFGPFGTISNYFNSFRSFNLLTFRSEYNSETLEMLECHELFNFYQLACFAEFSNSQCKRQLKYLPLHLSPTTVSMPPATCSLSPFRWNQLCAQDRQRFEGLAAKGRQQYGAEMAKYLEGLGCG
jgi:hypothetical protein